MKRKIIQIGNSTQLVSLPREWAVEHRIKKGEELDVEVKGGQLVITAGAHAGDARRTEADVSRLGSHVTMKIVKALYKAGYDEARITFADETELQWIHQAIRNNCIGVELVEQGKNYVVAKKILDTIDAEFDAVLRRTIIFLNTIAADSLGAVQSGEKAAVNAVLAMDVNINKFTCFCRRVLNRRGHPEHRLAAPLYTVTEQIEETADIFKKIAKFYSDEGLTIDAGLARVFADVNQFMREVTDLLYKFDVKRLRELSVRQMALSDALAKASVRIGKRELRAAFYLEIALDRVWGLTGPLLSFVL